MIASTLGYPIEFIIAPGSFNDVKVIKDFEIDLPSGSILYGDAIYNDYEYEDLLKESMNIKLLVIRKTNSKRPHEPWITAMINHFRKNIETIFSKITNHFPKKIHATTAKGFHLKVVCFIMSHAISCL